MRERRRLALLLMAALGLVWLLFRLGTNREVPSEPALRPSVAIDRPAEVVPASREQIPPVSEPSASPDPPPPTSALPTRDPREPELFPYYVSCSPGVVCGTVLRGSEPLPGARVALWPDFMLPPVALRDGPGTWNTVSDSSGRFELSGIPPEGRYYLCVTAPTGERREQRLEVRQACVVLFGSACVEGVVLDRSGAPWRGAEVFLGSFGPAAGTATYANVVTDAEGCFEVCGLPPTKHWIRVLVEDRNRSHEFQWSLELAPGERRRVQLGRQADEATWTGVVRDALGRPQFLADVRVEDPSGLCWPVERLEEGFRGHFPPGKLRAWLGVALDIGGLGLGPFEVELPASGLEHDLTIPGAVVDVFVRGENLPGEDCADQVGVRLSGLDPWISIHPHRWTLLGLTGPGPFVLELDPSWEFVETGARTFAIELAPGERHRELHLTVRLKS